jgi:membrane protein YqaA with SNARE-associated domain
VARMHRSEWQRRCRDAWDGWERFAPSRGANMLMFFWALAEATFWPIVPEFLLAPLAAGNRRRFYVPLAASIAGSALGAAALYLIAYMQPGAGTAYLAALPLSGHGYRTVAAMLAVRGPAGYLGQPVSGIPSKVWVIAGGVEGINPLRSIAVMVAARSLRMAVVATLARVLAGAFRGFLRDYSLIVLAVYLLVFFLFWWRIIAG